MKNRLILIEGLPGSGKSTFARLISDKLNDRKIGNQLFSEGNLDHPADYDGVAFYTKQAFDELINANHKYKDNIVKMAYKEEEGYFIPFVKMKIESKDEFPNELFTIIAENDIYELPLDLHIKLLLSRWQKFVDTALANKDTYIFECCFIQNPVTVSMLRDNSKKEVTIEYINKLAEIIKALNPILIYLDQKDIDSNFRKIIEERPNEWFEGFVDYYTNQGYGKSNGLKGLEGTIQILHTRKELEHEIVDSLNMGKYILDITKGDYSKASNEIAKLLQETYE